MLEISSILSTDCYKTSHRKQYSPNTEVVYSTWTPRKSRLEGVNEVVFFGLQYFIKDYLIDGFNKTFFSQPKEEVIAEFKRVMKAYTGDDDASHWEALHDLGYLPLQIDALPEGTLTPVRVPMFTIKNTKPEFYWLTNFIETIMSTEIWKPMTSATIALEYRKILDKWAEKTCDDNSHVDFQGHDFSLRGLAGVDAGMSSGAGHLLSFKGTDTIPAILWLEKYYNADISKEQFASSIAATEHSVAETNIIELQGTIKSIDPMYHAEIAYLDRLLTDVYPSGFFSYVSDTYNLWEVCTGVLPAVKDKIMSRDGRVVVRPDSGDPCDILCGLNTLPEKEFIKKLDVTVDTYGRLYNGLYSEQKSKGVIELLWETFGGTINSKGYKVLDPHIGCIYGDAITLERAEEICRRLESKGFASSNVVLGIGSFTYNMNTRDTFGFALKTTYGQVNGKEYLLYKDPITDDGTKKSQKGMVAVIRNDNGDELRYVDKLYSSDKENFWKDEDLLKPVFKDGVLLKDWTLNEVKENLKNCNRVLEVV